MKVRLLCGVLLLHLLSVAQPGPAICAGLSGSSLSPDSSVNGVWTPERSALVQTVGSLETSPDGKWVAFEVRRTLTDGDKNEYVTQIWISATDGSQTRQLTTGDKSSTSPSWSPDGGRLAYLSSRSGKDNVWIMDPFSGSDMRLTDVPMGVGSLKWSPDGKKMAMVMPDLPGKEQLAAMASKGPKIVGAGGGISLNLYIVDVTNPDKFGKETRITDGKWVITGFDWSPDGKSIALSHQPRPGQEDVFDNDISVVNIDTHETKHLVSQPGWDISPHYSPDGKYIEFESAEGDPSRAIHRYHLRQALVPSNGGEVTYLPAMPNQLGTFLKWKQDGSGIYALEPTGTTQLIYYVPVSGGKAREFFRLKEGDIGPVSFSRDEGVMVYASEAMDKPVEVFAIRPGNRPIQLTRLNADVASTTRYARSEVISWKSSDGTSIEGILTYPLDYQPGKRYPLIANLMAGLYNYNQDHTARLTAFAPQYYAAEGYMVLRPNPRGSNNGTLQFREAITADWSGLTYADNMSGVDYLIDKGLVDPGRMGVCGWSTGGYAAATVLSKTNRFKAASLGAAPVDLVAFTNTNDTPGWLPAFFGKEVWQDDSEFRKQSPLFFMKNVKTAVLIENGEADQRVPVSQAWELYNTLKRQGTEVRMILYPGMGHVPNDPKTMIRLAHVNLEWFREKLGQ
jgi:dipeptidyl aminopeptidase/acylaminoacyl peptidase